MILRNDPKPMMRGGTVADRIRFLERHEKAVLNTVEQRRIGLVRPIQLLRCVLTSAGV
jgi:hypothetical protein